MRRLVIVLLCLTIAGCLLLLAARLGRSRAPAPADEPQIDTRAGVDREAEADPAPADEADVVSLASRDEPPPQRESVPYDGERVQVELAQLRADVVASVARRPLFAMAQARGLPNYELFSMSAEQLLDAIFDAEALPPADVLPSPENADRVRSVIAEAFQRQDEYAAEEAASRDAG
jgi:hypothetical protein